MHNNFRLPPTHAHAHTQFFFFSFIPVSVAGLPRPICPFWATVYGRNLSGFGDKTGFAVFFRFAGEPHVSFRFYFSTCLLYAGV